MARKTNYLIALGVAVVVIGGAAIVLSRRPAPPPPPPAVMVKPAPIAATAPSPDCLMPGPAPVEPDGATATAADMQLGHDAIQNFVLELESYQTCRNNQIDHPAPGVTAAQKEKWTAQGDAAVDQAHALADGFAAQLKIFKARGPG